jgi:hypothetical protein
MAASSLRRLRGLIQDERALAVLMPEAERLARLDRRLAAQLPAALARRCRAMALDGEILLVHCDNGAAAARLRSQATRLAAALSGPNQSIAGLKVKVRADWSVAEKPEKPGLGADALAALDAFESSLPEGGLKRALARMLEHQRR